MYLKFPYQAAILIGLPLAFYLVFLVCLLATLDNTEHHLGRIEHAKEVEEEAGRIMSSFVLASSALASYAMTRAPELAHQFDEVKTGVTAQSTRLNKLVSADAAESRSARELESAVSRGISILERIKLSIAQGQDSVGLLKEVSSKRAEINNLLQEAHTVASQIIVHEREHVDSSGSNADRTRSLKILIAFGVVSALLLGIILSIYFYRGMQSRLSHLLADTDRLARAETLVARLSGNDEFAKLDQALHDMADALAEAIQKERAVRSEFMAMVSHDLREPLSAIHLFLEFIAEGEYGRLSELGTNRAALLGIDVHRLSNLVNDLLNIDRFEHGQLNLKLDEAELSKLSERAVAAAQVNAQQGEVDIHIREKQDIKAVLDEERIVQVLINLLSNAIRYSKTGSIVWLTIEDNPDFVEFSVRDSGPGVPKRFQELIFERYKQVDEEYARRHHGVGLGLHLCKIIIGLHEGSIGVDSEEGKGSRFWFTIPHHLRANGKDLDSRG